MSNNNIETALSLASKIPDIVRSAKSNSLIEFTKPTRVEPLVLMDDRVVGLSFMNDVQQSILTIFSGYYLQAVSLAVNVGRVDVAGLLDRVNPNRSLDDATVKGLTNPMLREAASMLSIESYKYGLPVPGEKIGLEHFGLERSTYDEISDLVTGNNTDGGSVARSSDKTLELALQMSNLSVGKLLNVEVESDGHRVTFPVAVRLITTAAPPSGIVATLSVGSKRVTVKERWHAWRAGQLDFIRDLVLCQDLIDDHKKGLLNDASGMYKQSVKRRNVNKLSAILTGNPSVATASNIIIMAKQTAKELETEIRGRLKDFRTREKLFKDTYSMLLVVIDPEWEAVTIYHRSIESPTELTLADMKQPKKGSDISDVLKAYQLGQTPSF